MARPPSLDLKAGNDIFLIFNQGWIEDEQGGFRFGMTDRKFSVKIQYTFRVYVYVLRAYRRGEIPDIPAKSLGLYRKCSGTQRSDRVQNLIRSTSDTVT